MKAEIIAIGTELLLGNILNTNAQYLSQELAALGYDMYYQSVVGDNFDRVKACISQAVDRSNAVIITGGLGPTPDDLSKEAAAEALGLELFEDEESIKAIEGYFKKSGRTMAEANRKQALFPKERCVIFPNGNGTAPGCAMTAENGSVVILMPGVPYEMKLMFETHAKPFLAKRSNKTLVSRNVLVAGIGESMLTTIIPEYFEMTDPTVSPYCKPGLVTLRVTAAAETAEKAAEKCNKTVNELTEKLGKNICGVDCGSIENAVVELLKEKGLHLATAESCTAGKISAAITAVSGASAVFDFGASTYSNEMKQKLLGVKSETLEIFGAVSAETACQMSAGIRKYANADIGLSVTGVAGPGQSENKPAGLVYISLCDGQHTWVVRLMVGNAQNDRERVRNNAVTVALDLTRRYLEHLPKVMDGHTDPDSPTPLNPEEFCLGMLNMQNQ